MIEKSGKAILEEMKNIFSERQKEVTSRLGDFERAGKSEDETIFAELVFCILTPQSKAKNCWKAVERLKKKGLLWNGDAQSIADELSGVRFHNKKASYIIEARRLFTGNTKSNIKSKVKSFENNYKLRDWLVQNVEGIGYKEASHFLRNIGLGENLAILDRHILKNLHLAGIIDRIPNSLSPKIYFAIEKEMSKFAETINIPMAALDLVLWCKETGEIFK
mgnify:CR=1 FL=1